MDFFNKNKMTILGGVGLVFLIWAYFTFFSGSSSAPLTAVSNDSAISGNLLTTLNSLHTIKLDSSIFSDPVYLSLSDFGTTLPDQPAGRTNPFAPLGANQTATSATQPSSVKTTTTTKSTTTSTGKAQAPTAPSASAPTIPTPPPVPTIPSPGSAQ